MKKRKRNIINIIYIVAIAAVLVIIALLIQDTRQKDLVPRYQAGAPTQAKFTRLARLIPPGTEFDITVDVPRALSNPAMRVRLMEIAQERTGVGAELVAALLDNPGAIGLITVTGTLGDKNNPPKMFVLAQGEFDEDVMLPVIRAAMSAQKSGISARDLDWSTLYYESDKRDPFGFMLLNDEHMAVGPKETLEAFFFEKPEPQEMLIRKSDDVLFGHIQIGRKARDIVPKMIAMPDSLNFSSTDGVMLTAIMPCEDQLKAMNVRMFLEGVRSLMMLQHERNAPLMSILSGITITSEGADVTLTTKLAPFLNLWVSEPTEKEKGGALSAPPIRKL